MLLPCPETEAKYPGEAAGAASAQGFGFKVRFILRLSICACSVQPGPALDLSDLVAKALLTSWKPLEIDMTPGLLRDKLKNRRNAVFKHGLAEKISTQVDRFVTRGLLLDTRNFQTASALVPEKPDKRWKKSPPNLLRGGRSPPTRSTKRPLCHLRLRRTSSVR